MIVIDPTNYKIALTRSEAALQQARSDAENITREARRRARLNQLDAVALEQAENYETNALVAQAQAEGALTEAGDRSVRTARSRVRVVAVTGSASFLGTNLIGLLEEDDRVDRIVAVDVKAPSTAGPKTRSYEVDFTQPTTEARTAVGNSSVVREPTAGPKTEAANTSRM